MPVAILKCGRQREPQSLLENSSALLPAGQYDITVLRCYDIMKAILTADEVRKALNAFVAEGKKPTLAALHGALGHRGSMSTLVRLKAEIDEESQTLNDSPEAIKQFREIWALAVSEGRRQQDSVVSELREQMTALAAENERLEGANFAAITRAEELERAETRAQAELSNSRLRSEKELSDARAAIATASAHATTALEKLSEAQANHARQIGTLQAELAAAVQNAHSFELRLARTQALLEAVGGSAVATNITATGQI